MGCITMSRASFDILLLELHVRICQLIVKLSAGDLERSGYWFVLCNLSSCLMLGRQFLNLFLRGRVKILLSLRCHSHDSAFDKNKELYLRVRPDPVWAVFPGEQEMRNENSGNSGTGVWVCGCGWPHTDPQLPLGEVALLICGYNNKEFLLNKEWARSLWTVFFFAGAVCSFSVMSGDVRVTSQVFGWSRVVKFSMLGLCFAIGKKKKKSWFLVLNISRHAHPTGLVFAV